VQPAAISLDYNLQFLYANQYWVGLLYKQCASYAVTVGVYSNYQL